MRTKRWIGCVLVLWQVWQRPDPAPFSVALGGFAPPLGINFYVDQLALLFAMATPLLSLMFWPWRGDREGKVREHALMLLLVAIMAGNVALWVVPNSSGKAPIDRKLD